MMKNEPVYPGLPEELAQARAAVQPEPMTVKDARRILDSVRDSRIVDRVTMVRCLEFLLTELAERDHSFDLRWKADMRAIKRWQAENYLERQLIWPDHADLCVWLLGRLDSLEAAAGYVLESRNDNIVMQGHLNALADLLQKETAPVISKTEGRVASATAWAAVDVTTGRIGMIRERQEDLILCDGEYEFTDGKLVPTGPGQRVARVMVTEIPE